MEHEWQEWVVGILGFLLIVAIIIGIVVLVASSLPTDGEPSDPNAILHILSRG